MSQAPKTYLDILAQTDAEARDDYEFDPRIAFHQNAHETHYEEDVDEYETEQKAADIDHQQMLFNDASEALLTFGARPVQAPPPKYKKTKRVLIIDTAQRDWTRQPNAYSNIFSIGTGRAITLQNVNVYTNSKFIPITSPTNPGKITGLANTTGWSLNGILYPPYNPMLPNGTFLFRESWSNVVTSSLGFGTDLYLSNIQSIRLLRAALPLRRFDSFANEVYTQSNVAPIHTNQNYVTSFHTQPFIFLHVNNFYNQYYGANNASTTAFAALVQHQRQFISPGNVITVQHQDFYPWSDEAHEFSPPMLALSNMSWYIDDQGGTTFTQNDIWEVRNLLYAVSGEILGGTLNTLAITNQLFFFLNRTDIAAGTGPTGVNLFETFSPAEFRVGDVITFYTPDVQALLNDPSCNPILSNFFTTFSNAAGYLINYVETKKSENLEFGILFGAVPFAYDQLTQVSNAQSVQALNDLSLASKQINVLINQYGSNFGDAYNTGLSTSYPLRIMNKSLQASLAFEVVTLDPDNSTIPFMVPN
jgi:hypothetical protein